MAAYMYMALNHMTQWYQFEMWATQYDTQLPIYLSSANIKKFMKPLPLINCNLHSSGTLLFHNASKQGDPVFFLLAIYSQIAKCDSDPEIN